MSDKAWKVFIFICVVTVVLVILAIEHQTSEKNKGACEDVGGVYQVVDREYSQMHKRHVDVYGCVK